MGVSVSTLLNWEKGHHPVLRAAHYGAICRLLGYNPEPEPKEFGPRLRWKRRELGWRAEDAARYLKIDVATLRGWGSVRPGPNIADSIPQPHLSNLSAKARSLMRICFLLPSATEMAFAHQEETV